MLRIVRLIYQKIGEKAGDQHIYHLLGRSTSEPIPWAITEEDRLEFFHGLQSPARQPERLFLELREKHLLLLGEAIPTGLRVSPCAA